METSLDQIGKPVAFVWQEKPVDREQQAEYKLVLTANDYSGNQVGTPTELKIQVQDINDNSPVFVTSSLQAQVQEDFLSKISTNFSVFYTFLYIQHYKKVLVLQYFETLYLLNYMIFEKP